MKNLEPHYDEDQYLQERYGDDDILTEDGKIRENEIFPNELKEKGLYFNRPAKELIFLKRSEHRYLHNIFLNKRKNKQEKTLENEIKHPKEIYEFC